MLPSALSKGLHFHRELYNGVTHLTPKPQWENVTAAVQTSGSSLFSFSM